MMSGLPPAARRMTEDPEQKHRRHQSIKNESQQPGDDSIFGQGHQYRDLEPANRNDVHGRHYRVSGCQSNRFAERTSISVASWLDWGIDRADAAMQNRSDVLLITGRH